ncbi:specificity protein phosphatase 13 isoform B [Seminavis robusta]|uniref:Specificity protein phosphatase 13 isoform B n=1 Tax=Seminavis robusta TaxID=568900 RepID=A0A9N8H9Y8_9STRA|nr:specificity protein phosphatase 13 isoform B [Seminavis robusta]|eukprot:Sro298_g111100.1 specificity protein phosphatase 13 isoform B (301) ;mRNA; r:39297-40199
MAHRYQQDTRNKGSSSWDAGAVEGFPWVFVGSLSAAENQLELAARNVTGLLTVAGKLGVTTPPSCAERHAQIDIDDHPIANLLEVAQQCIDVIDDAQKDHVDYQAAAGMQDEETPAPCLLVHCASGISRSVSAVVAWLMVRQRYSLDRALEAVRVHRPLAKPNVGFMQQLQMLEKHNGNLEAARKEWDKHSQKDIWELTSARRRLANDLHARVDDLEVRIQQQISDQQHQGSREEGEQVRGASKNVSLLLRESHVISDCLDKTRDETGEGLPMDRVTGTILKSARGKLERLIDNLTGRED